jgi:two-component system, NtrC family, sensor histidine kinase AtoS
MKKKIIIIFSIFSLAILIGGVYSIITVERATSKLDRIIMLHQVEILREHLLISIKKAQSGISLKNTRYAKGTDVTISDVQQMWRTAATCFDCHHSEKILAKLTDLSTHMEKYRAAVSRVLTMRANASRLLEEEDDAFRIGEELANNVNTIIAISSSNIEKKTRSAANEIADAKRMLFVLIGIGPLLAIGLTFIFITGVTRPVDVLLAAIRKLKSGDLDVRIEGLKDEFGEVAVSFNEMTSSLNEMNSSLKEQMHRLEESEKRYRILFESAKDGIFIIAAEGRESGKIVTANQAAAEMHGYSVDELRTFNIADLNAPEEAALIPERIAQIYQGGGLKADIRHRRSDGSFFPVEISAGLIELGSHKYILAFGRDISERKQAEEALQRSEQLRIVGELAAGLAHEIKNPLTGIKVSIDVMIRELPLSPEDRQVFIGAGNELKMIELLIKSLLNFAKPPKPHFAAVSINNLLDTIMALSLKNPAYSSIRVKREYEKDLPEIMADSMQLQQVFLNLLLNGVESMSGGGTLTVETSSERKSRLIHVVISDTGRGINQAALQKIFDPFFTTKPKGTGLGLAITKRLVEQHSGNISARNNTGGGASFIVSLPFGIPSEAHERQE